MVLIVEGGGIAAGGGDEVRHSKVIFELSNVDFIYRTIGDCFRS